MAYSTGRVARDGFESGHGRFLVHGSERVEGARLKQLFIPCLTSEANKLLRDSHNFVRAQLQHYGVQYEAKEFTGQGVLLLKKALSAGKLDKVPAHIEALQIQMLPEWLDMQPAEDLATQPTLAMEKYFLDHTGKPDRTKTGEVIGFPLPVHSSYRVSQICAAIDKVPGLHYANGQGPLTQTIYAGWDYYAVHAAADGHAAKETADADEEADMREEERDAEHKAYLAESKKRRLAPSPVGQYMVDCTAIEKGWDNTDNLTMSIRESGIPNVYQADFDFGILEGVMMLSSVKSALAYFLDDDASDDEGGPPATGSKRKATGRGGPVLKVAKTTGGPPTKFFLVLKCRETGEGVINPTPEKGEMTFKGADMASLTGTATLDCVGSDVPFSARKIASSPGSSRDRWENYSWAAYEGARVSRWH